MSHSVGCHVPNQAVCSHYFRDILEFVSRKVWGPCHYFVLQPEEMSAWAAIVAETAYRTCTETGKNIVALQFRILWSSVWFVSVCANRKKCFFTIEKSVVVYRQASGHPCGTLIFHSSFVICFTALIAMVADFRDWLVAMPKWSPMSRTSGGPLIFPILSFFTVSLKRSISGCGSKL